MSRFLVVKLERRKSKLTSVGGGESNPPGERPRDPASLLTPFPTKIDPAALEEAALEFDSPPDDDLTLVRPGPVPKVERMPEGIEVVEKPVGHASAQWIVMVRCQCGRRWFEVEFIDTATCPRCGLFLVVELDGVPPSR